MAGTGLEQRASRGGGNKKLAVFFTAEWTFLARYEIALQGGDLRVS